MNTIQADLYVLCGSMTVYVPHNLGICTILRLLCINHAESGINVPILI